ncbi:hypothetical protein N7448_011310 [Penicillium atrosanguineum]|nr:hypothetical protein N7448_011310 [Penicillium atrosanguineum]
MFSIVKPSTNCVRPSTVLIQKVLQNGPWGVRLHDFLEQGLGLADLLDNKQPQAHLPHYGTCGYHFPEQSL